MPTRRETLITFGIYLLLALIVYGGAVTYGYSIIDDQLLVSRNLFIQGISLRNVVHAFTTFDPELYIPFTLLSYQLNYVIGGLSPWIYHLTDIVLHSASALLITIISRRFVSTPLLAYAAGLIFLLHPLHTEAVVWISGRKDTLSTLFALLSIHYFFKSTSASWLSLSLLFFLCALLSKAAVLTLPIVFAMLMLADRRGVRETVLRLQPYILLSSIFAVITFFGKQRIVQGAGLTETGLMAAKSTVFYLQKLLIPLGLNPFYPYHDPITITSSDFFIPLIIVSIITLGTIVVVRKTAWYLMVWLIFLILLSPSFFNAHKGSIWFFAVDRYAYFSSIVLIIGGMAALDVLIRHFWKYRVVISTAVLMFVLTLAVLTVNQVSIWRSDEVMLRHSLRLYPDNVPARTAFASLYASVGDLESEAAVLKQGEAYRQNIAYTLGLGSIEARKGNGDAAQTYYTQAEQMDPLYPETYFYQGVLGETEGGVDYAKIQYQKAIDLDPSYVAPMINLGAIAADAGEYEEALSWYMRALMWSHNSEQLQYNTGLVLENMQRDDEALPHFADAYALAPFDPDIASTYAYRLYEKGETSAALRVAKDFLSLDPTNRTMLRLEALIQDVQ